GLAAGGIDVHEATVLDHRGAAGEANQVGDQLVAAVEQVGRGVGRVAADGRVDLRDLAGQPVDLGGGANKAVVDLAVERVEAAVELLEAAGQGVGVVQHVLPVGGRRGIGGQAADRIEEARPHPGHVGGGGGEHRIDTV